MKIDEYFWRPSISRSVRSSRSAPSVSAAEYRYSPCPASSWTLANRIALRRSDGARVIHSPSGCMPMISECACWAICRTSVLRYPSGIQSRGSMRWSRAIVASKCSWSPSGASGGGASAACVVVIVTSFPTDHSFGISVTCFRAPGKSRTSPATLLTVPSRGWIT